MKHFIQPYKGMSIDFFPISNTFISILPNGKKISSKSYKNLVKRIDNYILEDNQIENVKLVTNEYYILRTDLNTFLHLGNNFKYGIENAHYYTSLDTAKRHAARVRSVPVKVVCVKVTKEFQEFYEVE